MTTGVFPDDSINRKAILVLPQHDIEKCAYESEAAHLLVKDDIYVLPLPFKQNTGISSALQNIVDSGLARPGLLLIQSPYDADVYEDASVAGQRFALMKHMYFSKLCMLLGAKSVNVEQIDLHSGSKTKTLKTNAKHAGKEVSGDIGTDELEKLLSQMNLQDSFSGGSPDIEAAEKLLRKHGLWSDPSMRNLVEMRGEGSNQLLSRKLTLNLSNESKNSLSVVLGMKFPGIFKFCADYKSVVEEQRNYTLTVSVQF